MCSMSPVACNSTGGADGARISRVAIAVTVCHELTHCRNHSCDELSSSLVLRLGELPWSQVVKARVLTQDLVARRLRLSLAAASAAAGADPLGGLQPGDVVQEGAVRSVVMHGVTIPAQSLILAGRCCPPGSSPGWWLCLHLLVIGDHFWGGPAGRPAAGGRRPGGRRAQRGHA